MVCADIGGMQAMMFTARDFMPATVDPIQAVHAAEEAERKKVEDTLAGLSEADREAVLAVYAAQGK